MTLAPASWLSLWDPEVPGIEPFDLWNLTRDIPGHPAGSTVSTRTLEEAGYRVPDARERLQAARERMLAAVAERMKGER